MEDEYEELRNKKEAIAQWEAQISEIIQWYLYQHLNIYSNKLYNC